MRIKLVYKIHGLNTANGMSRSAGNDTFYETYDEALRAAQSYVGCPTCTEAMIIYKAHVLVRRSRPPIEIRTITKDGVVLQLGLFHNTQEN